MKTVTIKNVVGSAFAGMMLTVAAATAQAAHFVDTGTPTGSAVGAYTLDGTDFLAGQITFGGAGRIDAVFAHILDGSAGETFTIALYQDGAGHLPGSLLQSTTATFTSDGWNGASALTGWTVASGSYWIALEVGLDDTLGQGSIAGALLDRGVPHPLSRTAFDAGSGYQVAPLDFGLQVDATVTAVPEPESIALMLAGLGLIVPLTQRRRAQR